MPSRQSPAAANSTFGLQITPKKPVSQPQELIPQPEKAQPKTELAARPARTAAGGFPKITQLPFCGAWCPFTYSHLKIALPIWINEESWQKWKTLITRHTRKTKGDKILFEMQRREQSRAGPERASWMGLMILLQQQLRLSLFPFCVIKKRQIKGRTKSPRFQKALKIK